MLLLFSFLTYAADRLDPKKPTIWMNGPVNSEMQKHFSDKDVNFVTPEIERKVAWERDGYLKPLERDALFRKVDIETKLGKLDQMDKDMLVMGAKVYTPKQLHKQYPMLSLTDLQRLKKEVEKIK